MAEQRSKSDVLEALRESERDLMERLGRLPAEEFERGRYEHGWNGRQILAHIASIEWTYPRLLEIARAGPPPAEQGAPGVVRATTPDEAPGVPTRTAQGGIESYNDRQVAKRESATVAELLDEFRKNRGAMIEAVEVADETLFAREIRSAGGITGALADVVYAVAVLHVRAHVNDIIGVE